MATNGFSDKVAFIWQVADLLLESVPPDRHEEVSRSVAFGQRLGFLGENISYGKKAFR